MNTTRQTPKQQQLHESTAGEEDPGAGLDSDESAIKPDSAAIRARLHEKSQGDAGADGRPGDTHRG